MRDLITNVGADYVAFAITGVIVLIVSLVYLWWNDQTQGSLTCPGMKPTDLVLGNLNLITHDGGMHEFLCEHHKKFGAIFSFYWGKELVVSLASPSLWKEVTTLFDRPPKQFEMFKPLLGEHSIQYANGVIGKKHRQLLDPYFSFEAVREYFTLLNKTSAEIISKWRTFKPEEQLPIREHMMAVTLKGIVKALYGGEYFKSNKEINQLEQAYECVWQDMELRLDGSLPEKDSKREKDFENALFQMKSKFGDIIHHRRQLKEKSSKNFVDLMIEDKSLYTNDDQVLDMLLTYLFGGFHTTGNLLVWVIYFLCKNPDVEEKLLREIQSLDKDELSMEDMDKLSYMRQVIYESLRCTALAPYAARYSEYDIIVGGHVIQKNTPIILALGAVHLDPSIWPEPNRFDPDRFSPEETKKRHPLAFQPFGFAGKRKCPGYRFAYCEAVVFLYGMLKNFKVSLVEGQNVRMIHRLVTMPTEEVWVSVVPRKINLSKSRENEKC